MTRWTLAALMCVGLLCPTSSAQDDRQTVALPSRWVRPGTVHKLRIENRDRSALARVRASGGVVFEAAYEGFTWFVVDDRAFGGRVALQRSGLPVCDEHDLIPVNGYLLDGTRPGATIGRLNPAASLGPGLDPNAGLYLVQFAGPVREEWLGWLSDLGARLVQYVPMNAYVVALPPEGVPHLSTLLADAPELQYAGVWQPAFRLAPALREAAEANPGAHWPVTIQLVAGPGAASARQAIQDLALQVHGSAEVGPYENVSADLAPSSFWLLARHPAVFAIEVRGTPRRADELQGQIMAGNLSASGAGTANYLAWLNSRGFDANQFGSFSVNVVDDAVNLTGHPDLPSSRVSFQLNPSNQGPIQAGHGFLNASIVAGLNAFQGPAYNDAQGFNYGLGIAPWARVGSTAIFGPKGLVAGSWEPSAYQQGARISSNSWQYIDQFGQPLSLYDSSAQTYDFLVRDALKPVLGNQQYTILFAAGNDGSGGDTIGSPGTAKNVITVGASENFRPDGSDGCVGSTGADDIQDMIGFSSRGPVLGAGGDGRWKPEIVAPGTHIYGAVPQSDYTGNSICSTFSPAGQTLYSWSSGTSHSTPAVAGAAALVYQWFLNQGLPAPSPAMLKASLLNGAAYLTGVGAGDTLPSFSQGMGRLDLGPTFDGVGRVLRDQDTLLQTTGEQRVVTGTISDPGRPFRVTLVWTDAPGTTTGAPWVNDLDLTVDVGGQTFRGNVFSGSRSVAGGGPDFRNNAESVFLPAGLSGAFTVTVTASGLNGDGVPGNSDGTDQDFALVVYNGQASSTAQPPVASFGASPTTGAAPLQVDFTDLSVGAVTTWSWTFGDGSSSNNQHPTHTYAAVGVFDVTLSVSGPQGSAFETKADYVHVTTSVTSVPDDGSFEGQAAGSSPGGAWRPYFGNGHVISPSGVGSDGPMPTDGGQWCEIAADSTYAAIPPSNPGGNTAPALGGAGIYQDFNYEAGRSQLSFDAVFLRNEPPGSPRNDWMSVDVTDGSTTVNLFYKDTFSSTAGVSSKYGFATTSSETATADLAVLFPGSTPSTTLRITALVGNGLGGQQHSKGYIDNIRTSPPSGLIAADFSGSPTNGFAPLAVQFQDASAGSVDGWNWFFGDGQSAVVQNPQHVYTEPGVYTVTLRSMGQGGSDVVSKSAYISVSAAPLTAPSAGFTASPTSGGVPLQVSFSDLTLGDVTSWSWSFGDGATSSEPNPVHTYTSVGSFSVTLTVSGPQGSDNETKAGLIQTLSSQVSGPADGSFEGQQAGTSPGSPWAPYFGSAHVINPTVVSSDGTMPTSGSRWCEIAADGSYNAIPPSHPGGVTAPAIGGAGVYQDFRYDAGLTVLRFDAVFLRNESPASAHNDWMSVDITDGTTTVNLFYRDTFSGFAGSSMKYGYATTPVFTVAADLAALFPSSTPSTTLRITALVGNGTDGTSHSKGYVDRIHMTP